ncbi:MAG: transglutaminase family protein, partial [Xanthomonadales bacterium]|nr:transglutaminase family protein [Xanthomonadales bacterium]
GTGGGNHVTLGGASPADSPLLRRPDLLRSLLVYWQNHPGLSYLFSGSFIGPTSQAPRVDEARDDNLYELGIALAQLDQHIAENPEGERPWMIDRILRNFLVDLTGNTHRAEFCIDKLYPGHPVGSRLGLLEFRGFEMPPHSRMALLQILLLRALVARFWKTPYRGKLIQWGGMLHDRYLLPHYVMADLAEVLEDLRLAGYDFDPAWFAAFSEFRFPRYGLAQVGEVSIELRQAIEPWHVLGEEMSAVGTARHVDSSLERMQVRVEGFRADRYRLLCNERQVPLVSTGRNGEFVAGVRFRAWAPPSALHPTIGVHSPLVFDLFDVRAGRVVGGCTYHVSHPGGRTYESFPVNALEAESRRRGRFFAEGHTAGEGVVVREEVRGERGPGTLDLRSVSPTGIKSCAANVKDCSLGRMID